MSMSTTARTMIFEFKNREQVCRFILMYRDLFVPYAEETINCKRKMDEKWGFLGQAREEINGSYSEGYYVDHDNEGMLFAKMEPWTLKEILASGGFKKERIRRNKFKYVFEG